MNDFRISVFLSVARHLSFSKAALELNISQPAISKHINELENGYGVQLFERARNRVSLTSNGKIFVVFAQQIHDKYKELEFEMNNISDNFTGELKIGASTTIAQYLLPSIISKFMLRYPDVKLSLVSGNSEYIEDLVSDSKIDIGLVEGDSHKKEFHYTILSKDELVLVSSVKNRVEEVDVLQLQSLPLVLRENGSGTLEVVKGVLKDNNINYNNLNIVIQLGSSEAIKRYVIEGGSYAIISVAAILDELKSGSLKIVDIKDVSFERNFSFISQVGNKNGMAEKFVNFALLITKSYNI